MNEDRIERQMAFIIDQQAKFTTDIAALQESQRQITDHIRNLTDALMSLTNIVGAHDNQIAENSKLIAALAEQGKETDSRLNTLIAVVERHVSNH
jgi:hypothetical protein